MTGIVFDIQKFSIHDGPGIRTTVFLKGCPLHCIWCHNPESQERAAEISLIPSRCIGCGHCFKACPQGAHVMGEDGNRIFRRELCQRCGVCAEKCYAKALELAGIAAMANRLHNILEVNLMPYHPLGQSKSERLGESATMEDATFPEPDTVASWEATVAAATHVPVKKGV